MPSLAESPLAPEAVADLLPAAENIAEERLSLLSEFLESFSSLAGSAGSFITAFLTAHGIDLGMDDAPLNPTDIEETSTKIGQCPAPAAERPVKDAGEMRAVDDTTNIQKPLGEGEIENPDSPEGPRTPAEAAELETYLGMTCYQIGSLYNGKVELLKNGQASNPAHIARSLDLLEIAAKENGCYL